MLNNITNHIKNINKLNIMRALECDEKYINGSASDFEWFDEWERILPLAEGHGETEKYAEELRMFGAALPEGDYSRQRSIMRWREIHSRTPCFEVEEGRQSYEEKNTPRPFPRALETQVYNINDHVSNFTKECRTLSEISRRLLLNTEAEKKADISLILDISSLEYLRPDPYMSGRYYERYMCGEKLNSCELFAMYSQVMIDLLIGLKKGTNTVLYLLTDGDISAACEFVGYLDSRNLFGGAVLMSVSADTDTDKLYGLLSDVYPKIHVCPVIDTDEVSAELLQALFYKYPRGAFCEIR